MRIGLGCPPTVDMRRSSDGIGRYARSLRDALRRLGRDIQVNELSFPDWLRPRVAGTLRAPYAISALTALISRVPSFEESNLVNMIDLFHATNYRIPAFRRIPVVASLHDALLLSHPEWVRPGLRALKAALLRRLARRANHWITGTAAMVPELVEHFGIPVGKISVIHNGVDPIFSVPISVEMRKRVCAKLGVRPPFFLFVGTLQPRKNIAGLVAAHDRLPLRLRDEFPLVVVGRSGWNAADEIALLHQRQRAGHCAWLDGVDQDELRVLYQSATVMVFPSFHEGFGLPMLEAFASGLPTIASNRGALLEVSGGAALLVDPADPDSMAQAMALVVENENLRLDLVKRGKVRVSEFSWHRCAAQTADVYANVIRDRGRWSEH